MIPVRDVLAHAVMGIVGNLFGVLSAVALAIAALASAMLGLLAFVLSPLRGIMDRIWPRG